jgi:RNA polymerase sigma factor (sigma-70 family)
MAPLGKVSNALEEMLVARQRRDLLSGEVDRMPSRYQTVLRMKYASDLTLREIGEEMKVKESRACQLHRSALGLLRRALKRKGLSGLHRVF